MPEGNSTTLFQGMFGEVSSGIPRRNYQGKSWKKKNKNNMGLYNEISREVIWVINESH